MHPPGDADQDPVAAKDESSWLPLVYEELRRIATLHMRRERDGHTLDTTGVVHEAWARLAEQSPERWRSKSQFCAVASQMMRRILVDHARRRRARRDGEAQGGLAADALDTNGMAEETLLGLHDELERLALLDARRARFVELRFFGGLTLEECAALLDISLERAKSDWRLARAWLHSRLEP